MQESHYAYQPKPTKPRPVEKLLPPKPTASTRVPPQQPLYTCTIRAPCGATFASAHAWHAHELNEHFHNFDLWKCEWCPRVFHTEPALRTHWVDVHARRSPRLLYHGADMLLGPMRGERFWCGFCKSVLCTKRPEGGYENWVEEYYAHLGAHFEGTYMYGPVGEGCMAGIGDWRWLPPTE